MPHAAVDDSGATHLVYFRGAMTGGDIYHVSREVDDLEWSTPRRVNSEPRSALGMGPMDGPDMALSSSASDGRTIHVVWFLADPLRFLYTRATTDGAGFEPQRVLWELGDEVVEARPTVTADQAGNVYVAWHGATVADAQDAQRAMFLMRSADGGTTFESPVQISDAAHGACGCCSPEAFATESALWVSFRGAGDNVRRGQRLLTSVDGGHTFIEQSIQPWPVGACPVTTTTFGRGPDNVRVAWETEGQVYFAPVDALENRVSPPGSGLFRRKNPAIATNQQGKTIMAWGDGPGLRAGGILNWQVFDVDGRPTGEPGPGTDTIQSGSAPATLAMSDGGFVVIY